MEPTQDATPEEPTLPEHPLVETEAEAGETPLPSSPPEVTAEPGALIPISEPTLTPGRTDGERRPFWKRLAIRRSVRRARSLADAAPDPTALADLKRDVQAVQQQVAERFEALEQRLTQLWELEEQLTQVQESLADVRERQHEISRRLRRLTWAAAGVALAVVAGLAGIWSGAAL
ncbi:MAG: hypothetical protein MJE66_16645 [Proteobacteria bacterium]|nr:hypothetical protein [Pseudomonadota bacterium]